MKWMIAEDEADIRNLLLLMIQVWGHQATAYENGQKVWEWLDELERNTATDANAADANAAATDTSVVMIPDLILMDIRMPGKKGNELAQRMRTIPALKDAPIVLMTAYSLSDFERQHMIDEDGVDQIISKPLPDLEQLRVQLHQVIEKKGERKPS